MDRELAIKTLAEEIARATIVGNVSSKSLAVWLVEAGYLSPEQSQEKDAEIAKLRKKLKVYEDEEGKRMALRSIT